MARAVRASIPSLYPVSGGTGPAPSCGEQSPPPPAAVGGLPGLPEVGLQARPRGARGCWGEPWVRTPVSTFIQLLAPSLGVMVGELSQQSSAAGVGAAGFFMCSAAPRALVTVRWLGLLQCSQGPAKQHCALPRVGLGRSLPTAAGPSPGSHLTSAFPSLQTHSHFPRRGWGSSKRRGVGVGVGLAS